MATIGVLHPGEMGSGIGAALVRAGHEVFWCSAGRSAATRRRAGDAGLVEVVSLDQLRDGCEVIVSICPPDAALAVAASMTGYRGLYLDANAISPQKAAQIVALIERGGGGAVDAGIIGAPPPGETRLYLSGPRADDVAALFGAEVAVEILPGDRVAASALKMAHAAWSKGSAALLLSIAAMAEANGVEDALRDLWEARLPAVLQSARRAARDAAQKGWRWTGEMVEIAGTFSAAGLPSGFHDAARAIYAAFPAGSAEPGAATTLEDAVAAIRSAPAGLDPLAR